MGLERMASVFPGSKDRELKHEDQEHLENIRRPFLDAVAQNDAHPVMMKIDTDFVRDVTRFTEFLCLQPEEITPVRKDLIEDLVRTASGAVSLLQKADPEQSAVYATAIEAIQAAVGVYQENGGQIQFDWSGNTK